jgi:hypothetical protein
MYLGINKKFGFPSRVDKYILKEKYSYPKDMDEMIKNVKIFFETLEEKEIEVTIIPCQSQMIECRFVKHMRHSLMLKGFIAILLFFCC